MSLSYYLDIIDFIVPDPNIFLEFLRSVAEAAAVNPNGTSILPANGGSKFFINSRPTFINGPRSLPKNLSNCINLNN